MAASLVQSEELFEESLEEPFEEPFPLNKNPGPGPIRKRHPRPDMLKSAGQDVYSRKRRAAGRWKEYEDEKDGWTGFHVQAVIRRGSAWMLGRIGSPPGGIRVLARGGSAVFGRGHTRQRPGRDRNPRAPQIP